MALSKNTTVNVLPCNSNSSSLRKNQKKAYEYFQGLDKVKQDELISQFEDEKIKTDMMKSLYKKEGIDSIIFQSMFEKFISKNLPSNLIG